MENYWTDREAEKPPILSDSTRAKTYRETQEACGGLAIILKNWK